MEPGKLICVTVMGKKAYPSNFIHTKGKVTGRLAETAFNATLPNGKETVAFVEKKNAHLRDRIQAGDTVALTVCPSDFDRARVDGIIN